MPLVEAKPMTNIAKIIETVREFPGLTPREISEFTGIKMNSLTSPISEQIKKGVLKREDHRIYMGDGKPIIPPKMRMKPETKLNLQVQQLQEQIADLIAWKEAAIKEYPDLAVKPEILEARKVLAKVFTDNGDKIKAAEARTGSLDNTTLMKVALLAAGY